jgi:type II pantothenate kinase
MAGNLFDMGSRAAVDEFQDRRFDFFGVRDKVGPRLWPVDDLGQWLERLTVGGAPYRQVLFFVDNAGPDIVLGVIPFVRELGSRGVRVVLAANSGPALNDITAGELGAVLDRCGQLDARLAELIRDDRISIVESGCHSPLIDLADLAPECCAAAAESDLLILEGMGRAIESNYDARFKVDTVKVALIKDRMVADILGVGLFAPVFRFERAS